MQIQSVNNKTNATPGFKAIRVNSREGIHYSLEKVVRSIFHELSNGTAQIKINRDNNHFVKFFDINSTPEIENTVKRQLIEQGDNFINVKRNTALNEAEFDVFHKTQDENLLSHFSQ